MKFTPSQRLYALAFVILVSLAMCAHNFGDTGGPAFLISLIVAGLAYLLAIRELFATPEFPFQVIVHCLILSAVWQSAFLVMPPGVDDDVHRYVWDGRIQRLGYNPYLVIPNDPALAKLHTPDTRTLNNPEVPSPYPAGAQLFFRAITAIHESTYALKAAFFICDLALSLLLINFLRRSRQPVHWVLAYAWNPLLATDVAGSGHVDIVGALLLLISAFALWRHRRTLAAVAFALSVSVKFLPIVLLPLYWKRIRVRDTAVAVAVVALLYLPFVTPGHIPIGSLGAYVQKFRFNGPLFAALEHVAPPQILAALAVLVGLATAIWIRKNAPESPSVFAWPMAASLFCAPVIYPWYLLWLLPFMRSTAALPLIIWTVSILPTYYVWHLRTLGKEWHVPGSILLLEYGSVAIAVAIILMRRLKRESGSA